MVLGDSISELDHAVSSSFMLWIEMEDVQSSLPRFRLATTDDDSFSSFAFEIEVEGSGVERMKRCIWSLFRFGLQINSRKDVPGNLPCTNR